MATARFRILYPLSSILAFSPTLQFFEQPDFALVVRFIVEAVDDGEAERPAGGIDERVELGVVGALDGGEETVALLHQVGAHFRERRPRGYRQRIASPTERFEVADGVRFLAPFERG